MYDAKTRNRFRVAATALTGLVTVAAATATGVVTGAAARATTAAQDPPAPTTQPERAQRPRVEVRWKERPRRTVVQTRTVYVPSGPATTVVGGGSVTPVTVGTSTGSSGSTSSGPGPSGGGGSSNGGGGGPGPAPASPPHPPPPAPSSGS